MLVLSRHVNEKILINGGEIEIMVVRVDGDKVRLGIIAPPHIDVHREEIALRIAAEKNDCLAGDSAEV